MATPKDGLELIDRHLQHLRIAPDERRYALGWVRSGQRLATLATRIGSRRAVRNTLAVLAVGAGAAAALSRFDGTTDLVPALGAAPVAETEYADPRESD